ncbi:ricin-type beta-trefoil lectin domain protein [Streptomyces katsurahamanus]|uniref:Ricin-type beta-trefoil lectin domain protein n=1 Tax=Streptomyces katsurahamanus TaxID=2577098 RepID=A0ABW9NQN3_9ACTN|nr:ricin-type beta-trefoil lectin domain protein [Streptomyces katsurahamanus]MQS35616.1 ricin-type beta-trefoil lectin domain protein [Streptomyces katsurahamanus]
MHQPRIQGSLSPARTGLDSGASDEGLAASLRAGDAEDDTRPVAVLLARHWQPVFDYALLGTPSAKAASLLTTAAFARVLETLRRARTSAALRPLLLMTARRIAGAWAADERVGALPELRHPDTGRAAPAGLFAPAENRELILRSFLALPGTAQCLLWHTEAEAEGISVPAGLLAIDPRGAAIQLERAREELRAGVLRAHRELAPESGCRRHNRLLDTARRQGGEPVSPGVQAHLAVCPHCASAAEQLDLGGDRLATLLAEGVLGRAARPYLDSRPARRAARYRAGAAAGRNPAARHAPPWAAEARTPAEGDAPAPYALRAHRASEALPHHAGPSYAGPSHVGPYQVGPSYAGPHHVGPSHGPRTAPGRAGGIPQRLRSALVTGVGAATGLLLAASVVTRLSSDGGSGAAAPAAPVPTAGTLATATAPGARFSAPVPSVTGAAYPAGAFTAHLRHAGSGLCLDIEDRRARPGAAARTAVCDASATQRWIYGRDGLLRSAAAPGLCLNSRAPGGVLLLTDCEGGAGERGDGMDVRYDLTIRGQLIPRWNDRYAVVPGARRAGADVVVADRDGTGGQRWTADRAADEAPEVRHSADAVGPDAQEVTASPGAGHPARPAEGDMSPPAGGAGPPAEAPDAGREPAGEPGRLPGASASDTSDVSDVSSVPSDPPLIPVGTVELPGAVAELLGPIDLEGPAAGLQGLTSLKGLKGLKSAVVPLGPAGPSDRPQATGGAARN